MAQAGKGPRGTTDWAEVHRRVEAAGRALSGTIADQPEHTTAMLEERARTLARPVASPLPADRLEAITFALANEIYAIESRYVIEVFRLRELVPLPGAKPPVFGLTARRGDLLTILDLRPVLGLPIAALNDLSRVLVLGLDRAAFGILADAVHELVTIAASEVREAPEGARVKRDYVRGMTSEAVQVLDGERLVRLLATDRS
jgi:purine-binding chemotaxis protein CheW